jgi:hypothetical protein
MTKPIPGFDSSNGRAPLRYSQRCDYLRRKGSTRSRGFFDTRDLGGSNDKRPLLRSAYDQTKSSSLTVLIADTRDNA